MMATNSSAGTTGVGSTMSTGPTADDNKNLINSIVRACAVMEALADLGREATLSEVATTVGLARPTAHRILNTLERVGWIRKTDTGRYALTIHVFSVGASGPEIATLREIARPLLTRLASETGDTVYFLAAHDTETICLDRVEGSHPVRVHATTIGGTVPYEVGGAPFAILAWRPDLVDSVIPKRKRPEVRRRLEEVRARGFALNSDDRIPGVSALGAPVFDQRGAVVGGVSVVGTNDRFEGRELDRRAQAVMATAADLSTQLRHHSFD